MKHSTSRNRELKNKLNKHLLKLTGINKDFHAALTKNDIIGLKTVLTNIHNVLTLDMTTASAKWICKYFKIANDDRKKILLKIDQTSPNSSGFDTRQELVLCLPLRNSSFPARIVGKCSKRTKP